MPPKKKPLEHGQTAAAYISAWEEFVVQHLGEAKRYRQLVDPKSLHAAGIPDAIEWPCGVPRFTLVVDTAEPDFEFLVRRLRGMQIWAVARSMKRPPGEEYSSQFFAGDFAVIEYHDDDVDGEAEGAEKEHAVPACYVALIDVERKEISNDLVSSFTDGRRANQRAEHAASSARLHGYIIEGNINDLQGARATWVRPVNTDLDGLAFGGVFGLRQINTHADLIPTLYNLVKISARRVLDAEAGIVAQPGFFISGKKHRDLTSPEVVWSGMLQAVSGISPAAATAIIEQCYPTFLDFARDLVDAADDSDEREQMVSRLREVKVKSQNSMASRTTTRLASRADHLLDLTLGKRAAAPVPKARKKRVVSEPSDSDSDDKPLVAAVASSSSSYKPSIMWSDDDDDDD